MALSRSGLLRICAACVLLAGLGCAVWIYLTATDDGIDGGSAYVMVGDTAYPASPMDSRAYRRNLEYVGGKSAVMMTEFREWFAGLWRGASLAIIIGCGAAAVSGACLLAADSAERRDEPPGGPPPGDSSGRG